MVSFQKAKKEKVWLKLLLGGSSGSGKSFSSLRLATGIAKKSNTNVAVIDTENGRVRYYADRFDFSDLQLEEPYSPEKYIEAIDAAVDAGFGVIIIDSITHEWNWCLDTQSKMPGNSYTNWGKVSPRHNAFMEKVLQSKIHVICTVRGKDEYVMEEKNGKQVPKKVGLGIVQRNDTEYNYTTTFMLAQDTHIADATKDNTGLFEGRFEVLTEKDGEKLWDWANSGEVPVEKPEKPKFQEPVPVDIKDIKSEITTVFKEKMEKAGKDNLYSIVEGVCGDKNYNKISDSNKLIEILNALKEVEVA